MLWRDKNLIGLANGLQHQPSDTAKGYLVEQCIEKFKDGKEPLTPGTVQDVPAIGQNGEGWPF